MSSLASSGLTIPSASSINSSSDDIKTLTVAGSGVLVPVVYGQYRVPAKILNVIRDAENRNMMLIQCLWAMGCTGISSFLWSDDDMPTGSSVVSYLGYQTAPDASMVAAFTAEGLSYTDVLPGYAYSVVKMPIGQFSGQLSLSALIHGRAVYDPRKDSTAGGSGSHRLGDILTHEYSDNPSLAYADWATNKVFGGNETMDWQSVATAANANDELVSGEKRRLIGIALDTATDIPSMSETLRAYAGCWVIPTGSGLKMLPDVASTA